MKDLVEKIKKNLFREDEPLSRKILFGVTIVYVVVYLIWRIFTTLPFQYGTIAVILSVILLICELSSCYEAGVRYFLYTKHKPLEAPVISDDMYPEVDILVTVHSEEVELLYSTLNACTYLKYPDPSKIHIHLCDDSCRDEMRVLAEELGVNYHAVPDNKHMKAGNMNYVFERTSAPLVVTIDADMILLDGFLLDNVPYFFLPVMKKDEDGNWIKRAPEEIDPNEKVGFLQTPQSFYNESVMNFNLGIEHDLTEEQDLFFKAINPARNYINAPHYCGSNVILSREGLTEIGGFPVETITEDYHATIKLEKAGYTTYAIGETYAQGLSPSTVPALISQRSRWAAGNVAVWKAEAPVLTSKDLTIGQKLGQLASLIYWLGFPRKVVFLTVPLVTLLFGIIVLDGSWFGFFFIWLPYYILYFLSLSKVAGNLWKSSWTSVFETILCTFLTRAIILELLGRKSGFVVTDKNSLQTRSIGQLKYGIPHIALLILSIIALHIGVYLVFVYEVAFYGIALGWLLYNVLSIILAIKFMYGRDNKRKSARFFHDIHSVIKTEDGEVGQAVDLSKTGVGMHFETKIQKTKGDHLSFNITDMGLDAHLSGKIVNEFESEDGWTYGILLDELPWGDEKKHFDHIIFNRIHSLPKEASVDLSLINTMFKRTK